LGTAFLSPVSGTGADIFFAKYDVNGNYCWAKSIGSFYTSENGCRVTIDGTGKCYITGYFFGTADFDPGAGTANLTSVGASVFSLQNMIQVGIIFGLKTLALLVMITVTVLLLIV